jgi:nucleolar protein 12
MSGVSGLFADAKTDSAFEGLFAVKNAGPVKRTAGERTVVNVNVNVNANVKKVLSKKRHEKRLKEDEAKEDSSKEASGSSDEEEEEKDAPRPKKKRRSNDDEDEDLESKYFNKILDEEEEPKEQVEAKETTNVSDSGSDSDSESEGEEAPAKAASAAKRIDLKEEETEKAERTIFIGNLNSSVITSKKEYKTFKKRFLEFGEISSVRFRSIAFTEALPRKVAFVQQKLHASRDSINAYVVFKDKDDARKALAANGEVFAGFHLRVDSVSHPAKVDNNRAIFVGNLDFEEKEEELWSIFKDCGEIEFVRIVRDSKTNVGKGFGYVQFTDFTGVSKALLLNEKKLGEKKRKLRISRSKRVKKPEQGRNGNDKGRHRNMPNLSDNQKTKLGRAKRVLGKADRATVGQHVIEGTRAKKGDSAVGIKNGKNRVKKPRIRERSTNFKNANRGPAR